MKPSESFNVYDVPVGGKLMPPPSYLVNGIETPTMWEIQMIVERHDYRDPYRSNRLADVVSAIFRPK